jgi:hypothetical protein
LTPSVPVFSIALAVFSIAYGLGASAADLPIPPIPPPQPRITQVAPVPDPDAEAPITSGPKQTSLNLKFYRVEMFDPSLGFAPGSQYQPTQDRKPMQTPGFTLSVPIQ